MPNFLGQRPIFFSLHSLPISSPSSKPQIKSNPNSPKKKSLKASLPSLSYDFLSPLIIMSIDNLIAHQSQTRKWRRWFRVLSSCSFSLHKLFPSSSTSLMYPWYGHIRFSLQCHCHITIKSLHKKNKKKRKMMLWLSIMMVWHKRIQQWCCHYQRLWIQDYFWLKSSST